MNKFEEPALLVFFCLVLIEQSEAIFIKLPEKLVPGNFFQSVMGFAEGEADHASGTVAARAFNFGRL